METTILRGYVTLVSGSVPPLKLQVFRWVPSLYEESITTENAKWLRFTSDEIRSCNFDWINMTWGFFPGHVTKRPFSRGFFVKSRMEIIEKIINHDKSQEVTIRFNINNHIVDFQIQFIKPKKRNVRHFSPGPSSPQRRNPPRQKQSMQRGKVDAPFCTLHSTVPPGKNILKKNIPQEELWNHWKML